MTNYYQKLKIDRKKGKLLFRIQKFAWNLSIGKRRFLQDEKTLF